MGRLYYQSKHIPLYNSDCRVMSELRDESVQCVVTSPPYFGLRSYEGKQDLEWGGDKNCEHEWVGVCPRRTRSETDIKDPLSKEATKSASAFNAKPSDFCQKCGAWRGALGLEPTPEMYVTHIVEIMQEVKRVLRSDGVCFLNIGDSYDGSGGAHKENHANPGISKSFNRQGVPHYGDLGMPERYLAPKGLKPKDMCLIPQRLAIALQSDGWWVRSDIIWNKKNPMPSSVNGWRWEKHRIKVGNESPRTQAGKIEGFRKHSGYDIEGAKWIDCPGCEKCLPNDGLVLRKGSGRPTNSYEHILMLTKSGDYFFDTEAVREKYSPTVRWGGDKYKGAVKQYSNNEDAGLARERSCYPNTGRNIRDVWSFPTKAFKGAHFAVFPEKLPEICIKAATSEKGCCPKCGSPWTRIVKRHGSGPARKERKNTAIRLTRIAGQEWQTWKNEHPDETLDWRPTCSCGLDPVPCTVLDPFAGAGSTLLAAKKLGRKGVGYEISSAYCKMIEARVNRILL